MNASIRRTIRQRRPFDSLELEVLLTLMRTTDLVGAAAHAPICEAGLTPPQYNVLRILRGAGEKGLQTYQVAQRMVTRAPNITRLVDKLEAKGLLTRTRSRSDRRVVRLALSADGAALLGRLDAPVAAAGREAMRGLGDADLRVLCDSLNRLREPLEEPDRADPAAADAAENQERKPS